MTDQKVIYQQNLLKLIQIQSEIVNMSAVLTAEQKQLMFNFEKMEEDALKGPLSMSLLRSIEQQLLTYWRESIGVDTERFWKSVQQEGLPFVRRDELVFALEKGRFRRVDIGMGARRDWKDMKEMDTIKARFSSQEIERISEIVAKDELTRVGILKKCLAKKSIPLSQYLKFGECWAYMDHCKLWGEYFTQEEMDELLRILKQA